MPPGDPATRRGWWPMPPWRANVSAGHRNTRNSRRLCFMPGIGREKSPACERSLKQARGTMAIIAQQIFGQMPDGGNVALYTLANEHGVEARIMNYGGTLVSLRAPDRNGVQADIVLGFDEFAPYLSQHPYFGALIGRYANRIAGASFRIDDNIYRLSTNEGHNHLHGGR